jgi:hypothetical protein
MTPPIGFNQTIMPPTTFSVKINIDPFTRIYNTGYDQLTLYYCHTKTANEELKILNKNILR